MKHLPIVWLLTLLSAITACTKYEEGPAISFRKAENKVEGNWQISSYTVDGIDSMQMIADLHLEGRFWFAERDGTSAAPLYITTIVQDTTYFYSGDWFIQDKHTVQMAFYTLKKNTIIPLIRLDSDNQRPLAGYWRILRLKRKENMWLQLDKNGKRYELQFKPV